MRGAALENTLPKLVSQSSTAKGHSNTSGSTSNKGDPPLCSIKPWKEKGKPFFVFFLFFMYNSSHLISAHYGEAHRNYWCYFKDKTIFEGSTICIALQKKNVNDGQTTLKPMSSGCSSWCCSGIRYWEKKSLEVKDNKCLGSTFDACWLTLISARLVQGLCFGESRGFPLHRLLKDICK